MLKLFPLVVLPILAARPSRRATGRGSHGSSCGRAVVVGIVMGISFVAAGSDSFGWLTYEIDRGLQLESTGSGVLLLLHVFAGQPFALVLDFGTLQVVAPGADAIVAATPVVEAVLVGGVALVALVGFRREVASDGPYPATRSRSAIVAVIVALIVSSKVFSAQYVVWFLPLVPFLPGRLRWLALDHRRPVDGHLPAQLRAAVASRPGHGRVLNIRNALLLVFLACSLVRLAARPSLSNARPLPRLCGMTETKFGANCWNQYTDWPSLLEAGVRADRLGYDSLWTWDHLYPIVGSRERARSWRAGSRSPPGRWPRSA